VRERGRPCFRCEAKGPCRHDPDVLEPLVAPRPAVADRRKQSWNYQRDRRKPKKPNYPRVLNW
jgi:hypothetical protein